MPLGWVNGGAGMGIPQRCPLSMFFFFFKKKKKKQNKKGALYVPWCGRLEAMPFVSPQLYADNLKLGLIWCGWVRGSVCQGSRPRCVPWNGVLLSTSKAAQKSMKLCNVSGDGRLWSVELDVRDLGGH